MFKTNRAEKIRTVKTMYFSVFLKFILIITLTLDYRSHVNPLITFKLPRKGSLNFIFSLCTSFYFFRSALKLKFRNYLKMTIMHKKWDKLLRHKKTICATYLTSQGKRR